MTPPPPASPACPSESLMPPFPHALLATCRERGVKGQGTRVGGHVGQDPPSPLLHLRANGAAQGRGIPYPFGLLPPFAHEGGAGKSVRRSDARTDGVWSGKWGCANGVSTRTGGGGAQTEQGGPCEREEVRRPLAQPFLGKRLRANGAPGGGGVHARTRGSAHPPLCALHTARAHTGRGCRRARGPPFTRRGQHLNEEPRGWEVARRLHPFARAKVGAQKGRVEVGATRTPVPPCPGLCAGATCG
ncbi:hypothetical protein EDB86DRAFT_2832762 [Lactarius hatsudake]|nr:hypothetical protein EDB86DRAFT_2832762 [Lactarius hatsudake]